MKKFILSALVMMIVGVTSAFALGEIGVNDYGSDWPREDFLEEFAGKGMALVMLENEGLEEPDIIKIIDEDDDAFDKLTDLMDEYVSSKYKKIPDCLTCVGFVEDIVEDDFADGYFIFYNHSKKHKDKDCYVIVYFCYDFTE